MTGGVGGIQGTLAEYAAVDADLLAIKPPNLDMREAAALPLVTITAGRAWSTAQRFSPIQTLLVQGGAGGVGHVAVQIGLAFGAKVFATGSAASADFIRSLGRHTDRLCAANRSRTMSPVTRPAKASILSTTPAAAPSWMPPSGRKAIRPCREQRARLGYPLAGAAVVQGWQLLGVFTLAPLLTGVGRAHFGDILRKAAQLAAAGKLRPRLDPRTFTLDTLADARRPSPEPVQEKDHSVDPAQLMASTLDHPPWSNPSIAYRLLHSNAEESLRIAPSMQLIPSRSHCELRGLGRPRHTPASGHDHAKTPKGTRGSRQKTPVCRELWCRIQHRVTSRTGER